MRNLSTASVIAFSLILAVPGALAADLQVTSKTDAQVNGYIKIDDIKGESTRAESDTQVEASAETETNVSSESSNEDGHVTLIKSAEVDTNIDSQLRANTEKLIDAAVSLSDEVQAEMQAEATTTSETTTETKEEAESGVQAETETQTEVEATSETSVDTPVAKANVFVRAWVSIKSWFGWGK